MMVLWMSGVVRNPYYNGDLVSFVEHSKLAFIPG
jgi:hypothetical protein